MKENVSMDKSVDECILQIIREKNPETIERLVELVRQEVDFSEKEILKRILSLQIEGKMRLKTTFFEVSSYTLLSRTYWYWATLVFTGITVFLVFEVPENAYPVVYFRYFFGSIFVLLMPGYALIRMLYPARKLDNIERIGLSIGMSIALVCLDALLLNFSPWKITVFSLVLSLSLIITILATVAIIYEYQAKIKS